MLHSLLKACTQLAMTALSSALLVGAAKGSQNKVTIMLFTLANDLAKEMRLSVPVI